MLYNRINENKLGSLFKSFERLKGTKMPSAGLGGFPDFQNVITTVNAEQAKNKKLLDSLATKENALVKDTTIGVNESGINQDLIIGKVLGAYDSEAAAKNSAESHKGSEIIYKKGNTWYVAELQEKTIFGGRDNLSNDDKSDINLDKKTLIKQGMSDCSVSFLEDDNSFKEAESEKEIKEFDHNKVLVNGHFQDRDLIDKVVRTILFID